MSSDTIAIQARHKPSDELCLEKAANSDCVNMLPVAIEIQTRAAARVAFSTIFKVSTKLRNDFRGINFTVDEVSYPEESGYTKIGYEGFYCFIIFYFVIL